MKKYLNKEYLTQIPVIIFTIVLFINLIALVHALIRQDWVNVAADICVIVMLINWFVMWNMYEKAASVATQMIDENWELAKSNYELRLSMKRMVSEAEYQRKRIQELENAQESL